MISNLFQGERMRSKQAKVFGLILATAITSTFTALPYTTKAMTEKNGVIYVTNKDIKNGKVLISNKTAKSIVIKKSAGKAIVKLKGVKLSGELKIEKGDYILKTSRTKIKSLKISGKDTNIKFDKSSDLNKKSFVLKIAKNTTGSIDLSEFGKKVTAELGKNSDINIKVGNNDKASIVVKKSSTASKLELTGANEDASISKIRVESPIKLTVKVNALTLETAKKADKAEITIENKVSEVKNEAGALVFDKEAERQKVEKEKEDKEREEKAKKDKAKEEKLKEEKAKEAAKTGNTGGGYSGGGSSNPSIPEKKTVSITLTKDGDIEADGGKTKVKVTYNPSDATDKNLEWNIKEGVGIAKIVSSNANEAEIEALADGKCKIEAMVKGSSIKAEVEIVISNQASKALENRIKEYLTYTVDKLNKDNYDDVHKMSTELTNKIQEKIDGNDNKANWADYKKNVEAKINELAEKIRTLKEAENEVARLIEAEYNLIDKNSKLEPALAKESVEKIEAKRKEVSEKTFKEKVTNVDKYNAIKAEVEEFKKIVTNKPTIGDDGVALFNALPVSAKYELVKAGVSGNIENKELNAGDSQINLLKQMRNGGVGKYTVRLFKDFKYLKDVEMGKSAEKEVKLLEDNLGLLKLDNQFNVTDTANGSVKIDFDAGVLKWDAVPNAKTYDIYAELTVKTTEGMMGGYILKPTNAGNYADETNLENEKEYEPLTVKNHLSTGDQSDGSRLIVAGGLTETKLDLKKLIPNKEKFTDLWMARKADLSYIKIVIIPRNTDSLYISDIAKRYKANGKTNVAIENFKLEDFYKKFYKEPEIHD